MIKIFLTIGLLGAIISAKELYIAVGGEGNGEKNSPFGILENALAVATEGDIIYLREGVYFDAGVTINVNNLTISSYPNEWAKIVGPTDNSKVQYILRYGHRVVGGVLENIELEGGYYYALKFESDWNWDSSLPFDQKKGSSNITVRNVKLHGSGRDCVKITPASNNLSFIECEIYNSGQRDNSNAEGIDNVNGANMVVRNCYIHDIATNGIYVKGGAEGALIENNCIVNSGYGGIMVGFYTDAEWFDSDKNPNYYEALNATVRNNYIFNSGGAGIGLYGSKNSKVYNNSLINCALESQGALLLDNGDIWLSASESATPTNKGAWIVNNIVYNNKGTSRPLLNIRDNGADSSCTIGYNLYYSTGSADFDLDDWQQWPAYTFEEYVAETPFGTGSLYGDPLFDSNFHLTANSPAINRGFTDSILFTDYDNHLRNDMWDIGADEYSLGINKKLPPNSLDDIVALMHSDTKKISSLSSSKTFSQRELFLYLNKHHEATVQLYSITGRRLKTLSYSNYNTLGFLGSGLRVGVLLNGDRKEAFHILLR